MALIGYARVSTIEGRQMLDRQRDALEGVGCQRVFEDRASGTDPNRLGRLATLVDDLESRGIGFRALNSPMDTSTPTGRAFLQIQAAFAEMERDVIRQRVLEGMQAARARSRKGADGRGS